MPRRRLEPARLKASYDIDADAVRDVLHGRDSVARAPTRTYVTKMILPSIAPSRHMVCALQASSLDFLGDAASYGIRGNFRVTLARGAGTSSERQAGVISSVGPGGGIHQVSHRRGGLLDA